MIRFTDRALVGAEPGTGPHFRAALRSLDLTQAAFARFLRDSGDPADIPTIERRIRRWSSGKSRVPGEAIALLTLLDRVRATSAPLASILPAKG